jgi:hypothetical protein
VNEEKVVEVKVKLQSATVETFIWYGNSDPEDADDIFKAWNSLYWGTLSLWPFKALNKEFLNPLNPSWYLEANFSNMQPQIDLLVSEQMVNKIIEVSNGEIEFELEEHDWDGFEGSFYYNITGDISVFLRVPFDLAVQREIRDFIYQNVCFIGDNSNRFEHSSADGETVKLEKQRKHLLVTVRSCEFPEA